MQVGPSLTCVMQNKRIRSLEKFSKRKKCIWQERVAWSWCKEGGLKDLFVHQHKHSVRTCEHFTELKKLTMESPDLMLSKEEMKNEQALLFLSFSPHVMAVYVYI